MAGAVLMSRAVLPTSSPSGTSAHAPHRNTPVSAGHEPAICMPKRALASSIRITSERNPVISAVMP